MLNTKDASSEQKRIEEDLMLNGLRLEAFIRLFEQKQKTSNLSDKEKLLLENLKQEQFKIGFFYTTRLLTNLGKYIDGINETAVIKILEASGIEINEPQVKEAVEQYHKRQKQLAKKPQPAQTSYKTSEGMLLTLKENGEGRTIHLEEDLETKKRKNGGIEDLEKLISCYGRVIDRKKEYVQGKDGEGEKLAKIEMRLTDVNISPDSIDILTKRKLYENMLGTLTERMEEIEKQKKPFTEDMADNAVYWTHLTTGDICYRNNVNSLSKKFYTFEDKSRLEKKLLQMAYSLRELYGLIEIKTKAEHEENPKKLIVKREDILSYRKPQEIAKARHIMMYIMKNKFPFLSSNALAITFGKIGHPKNHATVLISTLTSKKGKAPKQFDETVGINPKKYLKIKNTERLYQDAELKYEAAYKQRRT